MTREEAKKVIRNIGEGWAVSEGDVEELIDKIYDDFESKICKNCKYFKGTGMIANCSNLEVGKMNGGAFIDVDENFGCNKFERRENERI